MHTNGCDMAMDYTLVRSLDLSPLPSTDIWSAGCIMAELITRKVVFPGADYVKQLECIVK